MKKLVIVLSIIVYHLQIIGQPNGNSFSTNSGLGYVSIPDNNFLDLQDSITIEMWVNTCDTMPGSEFDLLTKGWCQPNEAAYYFYIQGRKLHWQFAPTGSGNCSNILTVSSNNQFLMQPNTWYHIAVSHSSIGGVKMYINGVLTGSAFQSGSPSPIYNSSEPLLINAYKYYSGNYALSIPGKIDEVRLWKKIRTQAEISSNMNNSLIGNESGLVAYYKFEQTGSGSGITVVNSAMISGSAINGTTTGTVSTTPSFVAFNSVIPSCAYTSINEFSGIANKFNMYPNPADNFLNLEFDSPGIIEISDATGRMLKKIHTNQTKCAINLSDMESGLYILKFTGKSYQETGRFIKN